VRKTLLRAAVAGALSLALIPAFAWTRIGIGIKPASNAVGLSDIK